MVIEYGQSCWLQNDPSDLRLDVGARLIPAPWPNDVAGAKQFHAPTPKHVDLPTDQPVDDQEAPMMGVGLFCGGDVPSARRQVPHPGPGFPPGALTIGQWHEILKLRISINDADRIRDGAQSLRSPQRARSRRCSAEELTSKPSISVPTSAPFENCCDIRGACGGAARRPRRLAQRCCAMPTASVAGIHRWHLRVLTQLGNAARATPMAIMEIDRRTTKLALGTPWGS